MILVDTDLLIDVLGQDDDVQEFLSAFAAAGEDLATCSLSAAELLRGIAPGKTQAIAMDLLAAFPQLPFGPAAARRYGNLMHTLDRAGLRLDALDGAIAAVALENGGRLATRNTKHFERISGLEVLAP